MPKDVQYGRTIRKSYARAEEIQDMPHLLEIQKNSYKWFLDEGLREVFKGVAAITDYSGNLELSFVDYSMNEPPKYTEEEKSFAASIRSTFPEQSSVPGIGAQFDEDIAALVMEKTRELKAPLNDFLMPPYSGMSFIAGSTDVGDVSWLTPTSQIEVVTWPSGMPEHTWQTVACGKSSIAYKGMLCAGKVLAATVIDLIEKPELLNAARDEFKKRSKGGYICPIEDGAVPVAI